MKLDSTKNARLALIEQCRVLLEFRRDAAPCSHNLLATLRDEAADEHLGDDEARIITTILNAKLAGQNAGNTGANNEL